MDMRGRRRPATPHRPARGDLFLDGGNPPGSLIGKCQVRLADISLAFTAVDGGLPAQTFEDALRCRRFNPAANVADGRAKVRGEHGAFVCEQRCCASAMFPTALTLHPIRSRRQRIAAVKHSCLSPTFVLPQGDPLQTRDNAVGH